MALIECGLCGSEYEVSFYEYWWCDNCGVDYAVRLKEYTANEIDSGFKFLSSIRAHSSNKAHNGVLVLSKDLESPDSKEGASLLDTLLLFFDTVIVPDMRTSDFPELIGENKAVIYRENNLIKSADNSFVEATASGLVSKSLEHSDYDYQLASPDIEGIVASPNKSVRYSLYRFVENLNQVYSNQLLALLHRTDLFNQHRVTGSNKVIVKGNQYTDGFLFHVIPKRFLRNEIFCFLNGAELMPDAYYAVANTFREQYHINTLSKEVRDFRLYREWFHSTAFTRAKLEPNAVLEFRSEVGALGPFIRALKEEVGQRSGSNNYKNITREFCSEMDRRISKYKKVMGASHEKKSMCLGGLLSTLGSIVGGPIGAVVGGIGGTAASQLALEYDRRIPPEISFIANEVIND